MKYTCSRMVERTPKQWLLVWSRHKGIHDNDRVMHEMRALLEAFEYAGTYDQLNLGSLACMETLGRRMQSIVDAYNSGSAASPGAQHALCRATKALKTWSAQPCAAGQPRRAKKRSSWLPPAPRSGTTRRSARLQMKQQPQSQMAISQQVVFQPSQSGRRRPGWRHLRQHE